ncbi:endonuclease domain-containing protein [Candidatus Neomarinimicrobiota bacterium]
MAKGDFRQHYRIKVVRDIAKRLRKRQTKSEEMLWQKLRSRRFHGLKFLRQHPVGSSVVDFYCHEKQLAIEIDGPIHDKRDVAERDKARQELIAAYDIRILRFKSEEIESDIEGVMARLARIVE